MRDAVALEPVSELLQLLHPDGSIAGEAVVPDLSHGELERLYVLMAVTRALDKEFVNLQRQGELALFPSCEGQEAAQIGCTTALRDDDWLFPQYRELGCFVVRGIPPEGVGACWRGSWHGGVGFLEHHVAPMSVPIGTQALHAVGSAMASRRLGDDIVSVAFVGDGATSEGDVHEALNLAAVEQAPCIFFVQNNQWAISVPLSAQTRSASIAVKAIAYGMPGVRVDGNDVLACHRAVREAAERARRGEGPTLIEAVTYRLGPHTTSDDPRRYRDDDEVQAWAELDPLPRFERYLATLGVPMGELEEAAADQAARACARLREGVVGAADPDPAEVFEHTFTTPTPLLVSQRRELEEELGGGSRR